MENSVPMRTAPKTAETSTATASVSARPSAMRAHAGNRGSGRFGPSILQGRQWYSVRVPEASVS